jgi:hypothetical protein
VAAAAGVMSGTGQFRNRRQRSLTSTSHCHQPSLTFTRCRPPLPFLRSSCPLPFLCSSCPLPFLCSSFPAADVEHSLALDAMSPPQQAFEFEQAVRRGQFHNRMYVLQSNTVPQVHAFAAYFDLRPDKCDAAPSSNVHLKPGINSADIHLSFGYPKLPSEPLCPSPGRFRPPSRHKPPPNISLADPRRRRRPNLLLRPRCQHQQLGPSARRVRVCASTRELNRHLALYNISPKRCPLCWCCARCHDIDAVCGCSGISESSRGWPRKCIATPPNHHHRLQKHPLLNPASTEYALLLTCHFAPPLPPRNPRL